MTNSKPKKRGRPQARYRCRNGEEVQGLTRFTDGRWKISATGKTFVEADEDAAVARFYAETDKLRKRNRVTLPLPPAPVEVAVPKLLRATGHRVVIPKTGTPVETFVNLDNELFWTEVRRLLLEEPELVARRTGVAWVRTGAELQPPKPSPLLSTLGELYFKKSSLSANEMSRSKLFWKEFTKAVGVKTLREINHDVVGDYERMIANRKLKPKSILHRYRKVKGILHYAIKRGQSPEDCRRALDVLAMLEVKGTLTLDPTPITPDQFWAVYAQAAQAGDASFAALLLTALNAAMYGGEVACLKRDEVNLETGDLVTRRPKTKVSRIAKLWPQTIEALKKLLIEGEYVFYTRIRSYTVHSVGDAFEKYRDAAKLPKTLTFGTIRDAGFTVACRVSLDQARMLAGHRAGMADHYVRRQTDLVAGACAEIAREFEVAKNVTMPRTSPDKWVFQR